MIAANNQSNPKDMNSSVLGPYIYLYICIHIIQSLCILCFTFVALFTQFKRVSIGFCGSILRINCCDTYAKPQAKVNLTDLCGVQFLFWAQTNFLHTFKQTPSKRATCRKLDSLMSSYLFMTKLYLTCPDSNETLSLMNQATKSISKKMTISISTRLIYFQHNSMALETHVIFFKSKV